MKIEIDEQEAWDRFAAGAVHGARDSAGFPLTPVDLANHAARVADALILKRRERK